MAQKDLHNNVLDALALAPAAVTGTVHGPWIDTTGFESLEFILAWGAVTTLDSGDTLTPSLDESASSAGSHSDAAAVAAADYLNTVAPPAVVNSDVHSTTQRIGYRGYKRYVRLTLTAAGSPSVIVGAVAVNGHAKFNPTAGA